MMRDRHATDRHAGAPAFDRHELLHWLVEIQRSVKVLAILLLAACGANETHPRITHDPYRAGSEVPLACVPNLDGKIESHELAPALGATAHYAVTPAGEERPVDVAGRVTAGRLLWDWSVASRLDQAVAPIDAGGTTEGIYRHTPGALLLLGVASREENPSEGKTILVYENAVQLYRFPLTPGASWVSVGKARNGTLRGLPWAQDDAYEVKVDAAGHLALPDLEFTQALRVRMHVTITPAVGQTVRRRQVSYVSECFGEVARATSRLGEEAEDFTTAAEVRRLGFAEE
jgi:hypothetical protein